MVNLAGIGFKAGQVAAQRSYSGFAGSTNNSAGYNFSNRSINAVLGQRRAVVFVHGASTSGTPRNVSSVTIGATPMTKAVQATSGRDTIAMFVADYPANLGDVADVDVQWSAGMERCAIQVYAVNKGLLQAYSDNTSPLSIATPAPANCVVLGSGSSDVGSSTTTWTGLAEDATNAYSGVHVYTGASQVFAAPNAGLVSALTFSNPTNILMAAGVFST